VSTPPSTEDHIAEQIPWEHLTITPPPDRSRMLYTVAAVIVAAVFGIVAIRQFGPRQAVLQQPILQAPVTAPAIAAAGAAIDGSGVSPAIQLAVPTAPAILSEADLMAVDRDGIERRVAARAEWVVLEFFTLDPSDNWQDRVSAASSLSLPVEMKPEPPDSATVSYVEWVRTYSVDQAGPGSYAVTVIMRRLVAPDGATYERLPTEWVVLELTADAADSLYVSSFPAFTDPPSDEPVEPVGDFGRRRDSMGIAWPAVEGDVEADVEGAVEADADRP